MVKITRQWDEILNKEYEKKYFKDLEKYLSMAYKEKIIYPEQKNIYKALQLTEYNKVKVVIIGQDPYHGENEAEGLAFSVKNGVKTPPSLKNIFKELKNDLNTSNPKTSSLEKWAKQGVLLLNTILTVEKDKSLSHKNIGWEKFTDKIIELLNKSDNPIVFILWGNNARLKKNLITNPHHLIIESSHPSPFSVKKGFLNSKPFSRTNKFLKEKKISPIDFSLD